MSQRVVYFNGQFVPEREARVSIYDSALVFGDMAFEVTRTVRGRPFRLDEHLRRLEHTLAALHIDSGLTFDELRQATEETLARNLGSESEDVDWNIIHNISRGPAAAYRGAFALDQRRATVLISCYPLTEKLASIADAYETGIDLVVPSQQSLPGELLDDTLKTRSRLHYQLANLQAGEMHPGAWAVLTDPNGHLTEGTSGNFFLVRNGVLLTPRADNLLPGITRGLVLDIARQHAIACREANLKPTDATAADELFLTATSIGILHARSFNGKQIGNGRIGPLTARLRKALGEMFGVDFAEQARRYQQNCKQG